jgi:hypothetical protein
MGFIRNMVVLALGVLAFKMIKRAMADLEAAQEKAKVKAKAPEADVGMKKLKLDPVTGVYTPEA